MSNVVLRFMWYRILLNEVATIFLMSCALRLSKDQPEDGSTIGPKHVAGIII